MWPPIYCLTWISFAPAWLLGVTLTHLNFLPVLPLIPADLTCEISFLSILQLFPPAGPSSNISSSMKCSLLSPSSDLFFSSSSSSDLFAATPGLLRKPSTLSLWSCYLGPCTNDLPCILSSLKGGAMSVHFLRPVLALFLVCSICSTHAQ